MSKPYRILNVIPDATSCAYYRNILPHVHCDAELKNRGIEMHTSVAFSSERQYDAYIFSRTYAPRVFPAIHALYDKGATIVWELDDDLPSIPSWNPVKPKFDSTEMSFLSLYLGLASAVTCSTSRLAESTEDHFPGVQGKTTVLENLIDPRAYEPFSLRDRQADDSPLRVLFTGSNTHCGDMEPVIAVVDDILASDDDTFVTFWGYWPDKYARAHPNKMARWSIFDKTSYEPTLSMMAPHIGFCPLEDCRFNRCKSPIKWMELTMSGAAVLASDAPPFSDVIEHGRTGVLATMPRQWIAAYRGLCEDPGVRRKVVADARELVKSEFSWTSDSPRRRAWLEFYTSIPDLPAA